MNRPFSKLRITQRAGKAKVRYRILKNHDRTNKAIIFTLKSPFTVYEHTHTHAHRKFLNIDL